MDTVTLTIPASPAYLQVVRLIASGLGSRLGFTYDDIEDLKIGVDELCAYLTGPHGRDGDLSISFSIDDSKLEIRGTTLLAEDDEVRTQLSEFSQMILETVADSAGLEAGGGNLTFSLLKRRP